MLKSAHKIVTVKLVVLTVPREYYTALPEAVKDTVRHYFSFIPGYWISKFWVKEFTGQDFLTVAENLKIYINEELAAGRIQPVEEG